MHARCVVCGEPPRPADRSCRICLEPRHPTRTRLLPRNRWLSCLVLPLLFIATWCAFIPLGQRLGDPMTNVPIRVVPSMRFPVVVMTGSSARVQFLDDLHRIPALPATSTYLIASPSSAETQLNAQRPPEAEGIWVLKVRPIAPGRQKIELYSMNDGYRGGAYEATRTTMRPLYYKITGPGFAFVFGGIALLFDVVVWWAVLVGIRAMRQSRARKASGSRA